MTDQNVSLSPLLLKVDVEDTIIVSWILLAYQLPCGCYFYRLLPVHCVPSCPAAALWDSNRYTQSLGSSQPSFQHASIATPHIESREEKCLL